MDPQPPSEPPKPVPLPGSGVIDTEFGIPVLGELPRTASPPPVPALAAPPTAAPASVESPERHLPIRRRVVLPLVLFLATCASTFWVGSQAGVAPANIVRNLPGAITFRDVGVYGIWSSGLVYMTAVMTILFAHEMGHFFFCLRHRVPASLPFFIPMPTGPLGTMGAVIGMQSSTANRRELFDVGLAGPLAGLIVALPIAWYGILTAEPFPVNVKPTWHFQDPLLFKALIAYLHPDLPAGRELTANPLYMAGWVGMLITGLNMMPISQLDGGHVAYALFGKYAHLLARAVMMAAIAYVVFMEAYLWVVMILLVTFIGIDHPKTADDRARLGWPRRILGTVSLAIPVLCFSPNPIEYFGH